MSRRRCCCPPIYLSLNIQKKEFVVLVSIIIPVLNEMSQLKANLSYLRNLRKDDVELIFVDGFSEDGSYEFLKQAFDHVLQCERGRAKQMNAGARYARGDVLIFLHADTFLPSLFSNTICDEGRQSLLHIISSSSWGYFKVSLSGGHWFLRFVEKGINMRSRMFERATGDQCLFLSRALYDRHGAYRDLQLMEDVDFCSRFKKISKPRFIQEPVKSSSRRWEKKGIIQSILLMWTLQVLFRLGISSHGLSRMYYGKDEKVDDQ